MEKNCTEQCKVFWIVTSLLFIILTMVVVIIGTVFVAQQDSIFRMGFQALPGIYIYKNCVENFAKFFHTQFQ